MTTTFELKLSDGKIVEWDGENGINAAKRYVANHPETAVVAWRYKRWDFVIGVPKIVEPVRN